MRLFEACMHDDSQTDSCGGASRRDYNVMGRTFVDDEGGFTSIGAALAMLLVVALVVSTTRVCWVESRASDIQFAADAAALASENVIAEYLTVAQVVDATVLSMSLLGLSLHAVSAVAACIPAVGEGIAAGTSHVACAVMDARDQFSDTSVAVLNKLQKALPFLCALNAMSVIQANGRSLGAPGMTGIAVPLPLEGADIESSQAQRAKDVGQTADTTNAETAEMATESDDAARRMDDAKHRAYQADCGNNPSYCLYQRAETLAGLSGTQNPYYASEEAWSFSVPLERARTYYRARLAAEPGRTGGGDFSNPEEAVRSIARARYYRYAIEQLDGGSVVRDGDVVRVNLPVLARNTAEVRETMLYTEQVWPLTSSDGVLTLHASLQCPGAAGQDQAGVGAVCQIESGQCAVCPVCSFDAKTLGSVPAASTSIDNGFEHYWRIISQAGHDYSDANRAYASSSAAAKRNVEDVLESYELALSELAASRFDIQPPGRYGSVAIAIDSSHREIPQVSAYFGGGEASMNVRVAIAAATLAPDAASSTDNVLASLFAGLSSPGQLDAGASNAFGTVVADLLGSLAGTWGELLFAYSRGTEALLSGVDSLLGRIPFVGHELSEWASSRLKEVIALLGIEPANLDMYKPVVCNTVDVAQRSNGEVAEAIMRLRSLAGAMGSTGMFGLVESMAAAVRERFDERMDEGLVFTVKLVDVEGFPELPVTIKFPRGWQEAGDELIGDIASCVQAWTVEMGALERVWR